MPRDLFNLVPTNAVVTIQTYTLGEDDAGGPTKTWGTTVVSGVECLISLTGGGMPERFGGTEFNTHTGTLLGENAAIARQDIRFLVESGSTDLEFLVGKYLRVTGTNRHGGGRLVPKAYRATWEQWAGGANT